MISAMLSSNRLLRALALAKSLLSASIFSVCCCRCCSTMFRMRHAADVARCVISVLGCTSSLRFVDSSPKIVPVDSPVLLEGVERQLARRQKVRCRRDQVGVGDLN